MNRRFHLYPENDQQQRLRVSESLVNFHQLDGFSQAVAPFDVSLEPVAREDQLHTDSWQEFTVRPPIPKEKVKKFGDALIGFAESHGLQYHNEVLFIDHTTINPAMLRQTIQDKVGRPRLQLVSEEQS